MIFNVECPRCFHENKDPENQLYYNDTMAMFCERCGSNLSGRDHPDAETYRSLRRLDPDAWTPEAIRGRVIGVERLNYFAAMQRLLALDPGELEECISIAKEQLAGAKQRA